MVKKKQVKQNPPTEIPFTKEQLETAIKTTQKNTTNSQNHNPSATVAAFNKAKENIKQQIIASDKSGDNTAALSAIAQFKNRHG